MIFYTSQIDYSYCLRAGRDRPGVSLCMKVNYLSQVPVISIVDDDPSVRAATSRLVRSLGYSVTTFASAGDFLSFSKAHEPLA